MAGLPRALTPQIYRRPKHSSTRSAEPERSYPAWIIIHRTGRVNTSRGKQNRALIFTTFLRYLYGSFMTVVATPLILCLASWNGGAQCLSYHAAGSADEAVRW